MFLRFLCPAIVSPEAFGLADGNGPVVGADQLAPPPSHVRRNLILISKLLQNLANGADPFGKEEYMREGTNEFIQRNQESIKQLFTNLAVTGPVFMFV